MVVPSINRVFFDIGKERHQKNVAAYFYCNSFAEPIWFESLSQWHTSAILEVSRIQSIGQIMIIQSPFYHDKIYYYCYGYDRVLDQLFFAEAQLRLYGEHSSENKNVHVIKDNRVPG